MTTKHRFRDKYRLQLLEKDHEPMHIHLVGGALNVRIDLISLKIISGTMPTALQDEVMAWLVVHREELITEWHQWQR
ncbi:MAG: hypothetical protein BWK76_01330 [Desulfobulbaceae bacterium A2]|nr:MAG: hypothetical protein BWK76_01330 [Desulfobulbaceae bacterium A2]